MGVKITVLIKPADQTATRHDTVKRYLGSAVNTWKRTDDDGFKVELDEVSMSGLVKLLETIHWKIVEEQPGELRLGL